MSQSTMIISNESEDVMYKEFKIGSSIKIKINEYRSRPEVNHTDDMSCIDIRMTGPRIMTRKIRNLLEQIHGWSLYPGFINPNRGRVIPKWMKLNIPDEKIIIMGFQNKFAYEEWVDGSPGSEPYNKVMRFVSKENGTTNETVEVIVGEKGLSDADFDIIRVDFLGEGGDPNYCYEVDEVAK